MKRNLITLSLKSADPKPVCDLQLSDHTHRCPVCAIDWNCTAPACRLMPSLRAMRFRKCPACVDKALDGYRGALTR